ncbi:MAG TPA: bifunctional diguanylate cyclase/phosphodiesterase [Actinotalea sp.]|nr:bifunctional diguanylate cyclase/phosphodiesterase [Actinotalea sp.]
MRELESPPSAAGLVRILAPVPWIILVLGGVLLFLLPGGPDGELVRTALVVLMAAFFGVLIARLLLAAALYRVRRTALLFLAGSVAVWAAGAASISAGQAVTVVTFPAPGEILCIASYLGMAAFLLLDVPRRVTSAAIWLEAAIVWGATVCLAAFVFVTPVLATFGGGGLRLLAAVIFPLINLVLAAFVVAQMVMRQRARSPRSVLLMIGFLGLAVADSTFVASLSHEAYTSSLGVAALWGASFAVITEAATARTREVAQSSTAPVNGAVLTGAASLAVVVLALDLDGPTALLVKIPAVLTLAATGARLILALREAHGAAEAMRLSLTDELTGLPNRRSIVAAADEALAAGSPIAVVLLDLDGFKDINDSLGHAVGDDVLVTLGHRMRAALESRVLVTRLGGDEFALLVPSEDELRLFEIAQQTRLALREPLRVDTIDLSIDASVGIAVREPGDTSAIELLRRADIAMYEAKNSRAGVLLFDSAQDGLSHLRLRRGEALRLAIAEGQLIVWYQPQVDARTRQVVAVEALVRWWHPTEGLLPPITFLPDARRSGLMPALTEVVMRRVLQDARMWLDAGFTFRVAMNWAPPELVGGQLLAKLFAALEESRLPEDHLIIEVTEDSFLADPERARGVLHELRAHGIQVSIDDYGSGFSSLAYLRDLPVQELKMDRSFVGPVAKDERSRMIVQTTSQMARSLGLRFVAEGVEDAQAVAELLPLGVDVLQGYHIARPMPPDAVGPWVRDWSTTHSLSVGSPPTR